MSDFFDDMLGGLPENVSVKQLSKSVIVHTPVLYQYGVIDSSAITLLVDSYLSARNLEMIASLAQKKGLENFQILYPLTMGDLSKDKSPEYKQFANYSFDLTQYIPKWSKVISFGRSLFSICKSNDLDCSKVVDEDSDSSEKKIEKNSIVQGFYDTILWKTSFFDPRTKCQIFPVDSWDDLISRRNGLFAENFEVWFLKKQFALAKRYELKPFKIKKHNLVLVENPDEWLREHTADKAMIALDTETKGLDPISKKGKIICVTLSYDGYTGYFLRMKDTDTGLLSEYLKGRPLVLTNGKYDLKWLHLKADIPLENMNMVADTMILQQLCNEMMRKGLKSGAWLWTVYGGYDKELDDYMDAHPEIDKDYSLVPEDIIFPYATTDPCETMLVYKAQWEYMLQLDAMFNTNNKYGYSMRYCFEEIMMPALNLFTDVEIRGMDVDLNVLKETSEQLQKEIVVLSDEIKNDLGKKGTSFNVNSADDLGKALEEMGLPIVDRNSKGIANVAESQLKNWSRKGYGIADKILKYREISKNFSTFIGMERAEEFGLLEEDEDFDIFASTTTKRKKKSGPIGLYKYLHDDGKVHGNFSLFSTRSLRSRSFAMNLQQVPSHGEKAKLARKPFRPPTPHHAFLSTDLSGVQLRIGAILSKDKNMYATFQKYGGNMHLMTASSYIPFLCKGVNTFEEMQKIQDDKSHPLNATIKDLRFKAKAINFLCEFGGSASVLAEQSIIPDWSEESMDSYLEANGLVVEYKDLYAQALRGEFYFIKPMLPPDDKRIHTKAYVVAEDLVKKFFEKYEGLKRWEDSTQELAKEQGYIVTVHGTIRRLPYLLFKPIDKKNTDVNMLIYKNLLNISLNTQAQNFESLWINRATVNAMKEMKEKGLYAHYENGELVGGYIMGCIHDAEEAVTDLSNDIYKEQVKIMHKWFCKPYPEAEGIPIECETNIAPTYITGELWDMGTEVSPETIDNYSPKR